jgi:DNA-binding XRE family transcriptional regulator
MKTHVAGLPCDIYESVDYAQAPSDGQRMEGDLQRTLGRNLRAYRKAHDLSQETFAEIMGVHRTYMGGVERGERNLTLRSLERIAGRIKIDPLDLLRPSEDHGHT